MSEFRILCEETTPDRYPPGPLDRQGGHRGQGGRDRGSGGREHGGGRDRIGGPGGRDREGGRGGGGGRIHTGGGGFGGGDGTHTGIDDETTYPDLDEYDDNTHVAERVDGRKPFSLTQVNECILRPNICGGGQCTDTLEGYDCECYPGYRKDNNFCIGKINNRENPSLLRMIS